MCDIGRSGVCLTYLPKATIAKFTARDMMLRLQTCSRLVSGVVPQDSFQWKRLPGPRIVCSTKNGTGQRRSQMRWKEMSRVQVASSNAGLSGNFAEFEDRISCFFPDDEDSRPGQSDVETAEAELRPEVNPEESVEEDDEDVEEDEWSDEEQELNVHEEALDLLEWPLVCHQLIYFTCTPMGAAIASQGRLPLGMSIHASEQLIEETAAALAIDKTLDFSGVEDLRTTIEKARVKMSCSLQELWNVATTLQAARRLHHQLDVRSPLPTTATVTFTGIGESSQQINVGNQLALKDVEAPRSSQDLVPLNELDNELLHADDMLVKPVPGVVGDPFESGKSLEAVPSAGGVVVKENLRQGPLQTTLQGANLCSELLTNIEHCLDGSLGRVLDRASKKLTDVRHRRAANSKELQGMLTESARKLHEAGASDGPLVVLRRGRLCVGVRAGFKNLLPGGLTIDVSNSGATLFIEPALAIELNNTEAELASEEADEIAAILDMLTSEVASCHLEISDILERITTLDLTVARAGHANWLGAVRPRFSGSLGGDILAGGGAESDAGSEAVNLDALWKVHIPNVRHPLLLGRALQLPNKVKSEPRKMSHRASSISQVSADLENTFPSTVSNGNSPTTLPVPIDIKIASHVNVVAITGPNTGGKTAALKTLGMAALMAKAGLYIPASGQVILPWFNLVLADIGDEQSLEQSLSTFSGHIRRLARILQAADTSSLVLLDEVGSGTDPLEGASLAAAVLRHLAQTTKLAVATTHYAELKRLKASDLRFENASVEFDTETLRPTYRVLWGQPGQSNAFSIAAALNFDHKVLARARQLATELSPSQAGTRSSDLIGPLLSQKQAQQERARAAHKSREAADQLYSLIKEESDDLQNRERLQLRQQEGELSVAVSTAQQRIAAQVARLKKLVAMDVSSEATGAGVAPFDPQVQVKERQGGGEQGEIVALEVAFENVSAEVARIVSEFVVSPAELTAMGSPRMGSRGGAASYTTQGDGHWVPSIGDKVVVRKLGNSPVTVVELSESGQELTVQLGMMRMTVKAKEVLPAEVLHGAEVKGDDSVASAQMKRLKVWQTKVNKVWVEEAQSPSRDGGTPAVVYDARVQTSANTVDLRGMRVDEAVRELDLSLASRAPGSVVFVVHGLGTGAVKQAVLELLQKHNAVAKHEPESSTNLGCTVAYIK